ncbi:MAG: hypothetical protein ACJATA_001706 [Sphingobacteriales bacterium]|jgi:hypothetical protein
MATFVLNPISMHLITLDEVPFEVLADTFDYAFSDYFVKFSNDPEKLKKRWELGGANFALSAGLIQDNHLVGFLVNAIEERNGEMIAHNLATGIIPEFRGEGGTGLMYGMLGPMLAKQGVKKYSLEIITKNKWAVKAYENIGFQEVRTLVCLSADKVLAESDEEVKNESISWEWVEKTLFNSSSWEQDLEKIKKNESEFEFLAISNAWLIIQKHSGQVMFGGKNDDAKNATLIPLFKAVEKKYSLVKWNNIDSSEQKLLGYLGSLGFKETFKQFEMLKIS